MLIPFRCKERIVRPFYSFNSKMLPVIDSVYFNDGFLYVIRLSCIPFDWYWVTN